MNKLDYFEIRIKNLANLNEIVNIISNCEQTYGEFYVECAVKMLILMRKVEFNRILMGIYV